MPAERPLRDGREAGFHLIETMRFEPGAGLLRRDMHLARLEDSARALGFAFNHEAIERRLAALDGAGETLRVRLTLRRDGSCAVETFPFAPLADGTIWKIRIASERLFSTDPLLRHKTSRRAVYEAARAEFSPPEADEVLLLNENGQICEGAITSLFVRPDDGPLATPPLESGLLAGVLRAELIAKGLAQEKTLWPIDLAGAAAIFVGNSLRGLIPATLSQD